MNRNDYKSEAEYLTALSEAVAIKRGYRYHTTAGTWIYRNCSTFLPPLDGNLMVELIEEARGRRFIHNTGQEPKHRGGNYYCEFNSVELECFDFGLAEAPTLPEAVALAFLEIPE